MNSQELTRRDFHRMTAAALGGVLAGSVAGCAAKTPPAPPTKGGGAAAGSGTTPATTPGGEAVASADHACRGLNTCKSDKNACAGQSECATKTHSCASQNECKNLGGCGENPGSNACKGMGGCEVPMTHGDAWERARKSFEARMKKEDKKFGDAPAKAGAKPEEKPSEEKKPDEKPPEEKTDEKPPESKSTDEKPAEGEKKEN